VEKGVFGDFVAGRLLTPHTAIMNEDYIRRLEVAVKKRFAEEDLVLSPTRALLAASAGMLVEALPSPINDNLLISIIASLAALVPL
jgi:hypothetical protein